MERWLGGCREARVRQRGGGLEAVVKAFQCWVSIPGRGFSVCLLVLFVAFPSSCVLCVCVGFSYASAFCGRTMGGGKSVKARRRVGCKGKHPGYLEPKTQGTLRAKLVPLFLTIKRSLRTIPAQIGSTAGVFCHEENEFTLGINERGGIYGC